MTAPPQKRTIHTTPDQFGRVQYTDTWTVDDPPWCGVCGRAARCGHVGSVAWRTRGQVFFELVDAGLPR